MNKILKNIGIGAIILAIGYIGGRYLHPTKTETVEVTKEVVKKDVVTIVKEITRPDGTKETETTTTDRSTETNNTKHSTKVAAKPAWKANVMANYLSDKSKMEYGIMVQKDYLGPISVGAYATTEKTIGITVGMSF